MKWGCRGHWGQWGHWGCWGHWGYRSFKAWKITIEDLRVIQAFEFTFILISKNSNFWWIEAVEVIEATEVIEAVEVIETAEVLRPRKSLLRPKESSRSLNSALFWCFENKIIFDESWNIMLNFSTFSVRGCWGQPISLFQKLITKTQISNPPEPAMDHDSLKLMILLPFIAIYFRSFGYETPCINW